MLRQHPDTKPLLTSTKRSWDMNGEEYARYAHTKLANALFSFELQPRLNNERVPIIGTYPHPGAVRRSALDCTRLGKGQALTNGIICPADGALTPLFCAIHPQVKIEGWMWKGKFVMPFGGIMMGNPRVGHRTMCTLKSVSRVSVARPV